METVMKILHIAAALAASLSVALVASPATAQVPTPGERISISYADLDLTSHSGVAALNRRIRTAAEAACGPTSDADPHGRNLVQECRVRAIQTASSQAGRA